MTPRPSAAAPAAASRSRSRAALAAMLALAGTMAGCQLLRSPSLPPTTFYILSSTTDPAGARSGQALALGLGPISFPPYLERPEMVSRVAPNELAFNEFDRWSEPLKDNFTRVLAADLDKLLNIDRIVSYPWYSTTKLDYAIQVAVLRFEPQPSGDVAFDARWWIRKPQSNAVVNRDTHLSRPAGSASQVAEAMSQMVGELARDIAGALRELDSRAAR